MSAFTVTMIGIFGLLFGSFLNVVIARLPLEDPKERSVNGRSRCPKCGHAIAMYDNIPLISWLILGGKCRHCKEPISIRYPIVEALNAGLWVAVALASDDWRTVLPGMVLMSLLIPAAAIDIDHYIIPNRITYPGTLIGLALGIGLGPQPRFRADDLWWLEVILSSFLAATFLLIAALLKPGGMGIGDVKLAALMGAFLGSSVIVGMFAGFILALLPSAVLFARHGSKARKMRIPFGPFLCAGTVVGWFWGPQILDWYLKGF